MSAPHYQDDLLTLWHGDALNVAVGLPSGSVQTIVTSPPYFGLRDYGAEGQMGAEETVDAYVAGMVALFAELRRVLADDGTLWLNLGDSYTGARGGPNGVNGEMANRAVAQHRQAVGTRTVDGLANKNLLGVPWRVAFALQADGWILRSDIIWAKPNPMPESVTDRPTKAHEYVFLLAKSPRYFYNADAIRTPTTATGRTWDQRKASGEPVRYGTAGQSSVGKESSVGKGGFASDERGANARTVWAVPTTPFSEAHFAVYPPELIRPCILAGSRPGDTVLDPFSGSGTTGMVATEEGRKYVGIDLNSDYLDLSLKTRFAQPVLNFGGVA